MSATISPRQPARRDSTPRLSRRCWSRVGPRKMGNLPWAALDPMHRADVHIIEPAGSELWLDVRIHTVHVDQPIGRDLFSLREEHRNVVPMVLTIHGYDLNRLDQGMVPVVLEQHGRTAPRPQAIFQKLLQHRTQLLVLPGLAANSTAKRQANSELRAPLVCILLRAPWQSLTECQRKPANSRFLARPENIPVWGKLGQGPKRTVPFLSCRSPQG